MSLEAGTWISDLVETNPVGTTDKVKSLDDHDRLIKKVLQNSLPDHNFPMGSKDLGGTANVYTVTFVQNAPTAYTKYMRIIGAIPGGEGNTGSSTINVNTLGAKTIKRPDGTALQSGDMPAGSIVDIVYNGTDFILLSASPREVDSTIGKHTAWIPAAAILPTVSNGCGALQRFETTAGRPDIVGLPFDAAADEFGQFTVAFPKSWDEGTVLFRVHWASIAGGSGDVIWTLQGVAVSDNDTVDVAYGTAISVTDTSHATAEDHHVSAESSAVTIGGTPAENDLVFFRVGRDADAVGDTLPGDGILEGITIILTTNAETDD